MMPIRPATVADADAIAALHVASWRSAYRGILKDGTLGTALDGERRAHWRRKLAAMTPTDAVLIVEGQGFIAAWTAGDPGFGAYIDNLHVHPERRSAGLGRRLLGRPCGGSPIAARRVPICGCSMATRAPSISTGGWAARSSNVASTRLTA
jgi:ribosomal protein S18 acetylase RimI-like enzyme